ncbi:MAG TPA: radical SAM protein [Kofleriaceae bacterium]|nr:radical SAM protein [Kofleriaceae bacterium]
MHELTRFSALEMAALWRGNRRRLAEDHLRGQAQASGRPSHLKIELTNFCNLACPLCPHPQMRREVGYMRPELFRRIIDEAAPELEFAYLHHLGESLFHARLGELIRYGRSRGAAMGLSTNATFLDAKKSRILLDSGLDFLVISVDGATPATYERMRVGADFATTVANVRALFAQKRTVPNHTAVVVQMIVTPLNRHEIDDFAAQWEGDGAQVMIKEARDWAGQVRLERPVSPPPVAGPCKLPWTELTILWDGAVVPCANFTERTHAVGDLASQSLDEIWNGPALAQLRAAHAADAVAAVPICAGCPRQPFDHADFVALDQLALRRRTYLRPTGDHSPRPGLS